MNIPPLTIQPVVENAVKHGILKCLNGGTFCIRIKKFPNHFEASIVDDENGMTAKEVEQLFIKKCFTEKIGIGLRNVDHRLKRFMG